MLAGTPPDRPYVLLSAAMSADGYIDDSSPRRLVLSGPEDLDRVDELRAGCDAIMVGAQTIRSDDPRLLIRSAERRQRREQRQVPASPAKVTITASGDLSPAARFFAADGARKLVYAGAAVAQALARRLDGQATVIALPAGGGLRFVLGDLAARGTGRLMIEGGARLLGQALAQDLADELQLAIAPLFVADPAAPRLLAGAPAPGRLRLADAGRAGETAVLRYLPGGRAGSAASSGSGGEVAPRGERRA
jgi:5-amino-6-(5-phosphoribosylamino)uracil reductase